jgi:O-antigen/teichoic acid export membrane protein
MKEMSKRLQHMAVRVLRWSEKYTKTDMVYLAQTGWWTNLNILIITILGLLLSIAFANLLSPEMYGVYQYLLSIAALVTAISLSGMSTAVSQAAARGYEGVIRTAVRAQFQWAVIPVLASLAGAVYYFAHGTLDLGFGLVAIALLTPIVNSFSIYSAFLTGKQKFESNFYFSTGISITYYIVMFIMALFVKDAALFVIANLGVNAIGMGFAYWKTMRLYKPNHKVDPEAIPFGRHLSVLSAFGTILTQLDSILVFHFLGAAQLAVYSFTTLIPERAAGLFNFIGLASFPKFATQPLDHIRKGILSKVVRIATLTIVATVVYALLAPLLFHLLFPRYIVAIPYTQLYAPIIALISVQTLVQTTLTAKRFTRQIYIMSIVQPILLICLQIPMLLAYSSSACAAFHQAN